MIFRHYRELATPERARSWFKGPGCSRNRVAAMLREMSEQSSDIDREELQKRWNRGPFS
jgi:hypothetical protein